MKKLSKREKKATKRLKRTIVGMMPLLMITAGCRVVFGILERATFVEPMDIRMPDP